MRAATEHLDRLVKERHSAVRDAFNKIIEAISTNDGAQVIAQNSNLDDALEELGKVVAREHWPDWLSQLKSNARNYRTNHNNGKATWVAHLKSLMINWQPMDNHVWFQDDVRPPTFDPDSIINAAREEFRIDELFDRIIATLKQLSICEDLDSAKAINDLKEIITLMQKARAGSFSSQIASWQFVRRFVPNLVSSYLKSSKLAGPAIEAFEKTADELDMELGKAKDSISENLLSAARDTFRSKGMEQITVAQIPLLPDFRQSGQ